MTRSSLTSHPVACGRPRARRRRAPLTSTIPPSDRPAHDHRGERPRHQRTGHCPHDASCDTSLPVFDTLLPACALCFLILLCSSLCVRAARPSIHPQGVGEARHLWAHARARRGAQLKVMAAVENKVPRLLLGSRRRTPSRTTVRSSARKTLVLPKPEELSYALGKKGMTRKKLARSSGCIVEYVGYTVFMSGSATSARAPRSTSTGSSSSCAAPCTSRAGRSATTSPWSTCRATASAT